MMLLSTPTLAQQPEIQNDSWELAANMVNLTDVSPNHWAYNAVKFLVQELNVMSPKTSSSFMGNSSLTRYELANVFYRAMRRLEQESGQDFSKLSTNQNKSIPDAGSDFTAVNAVVNKYGIMQLIQGKFHGNLPISRYEIAFELANYFTLIEKSTSGKSACNISDRSRASQLRDLNPGHWTYKAVKSIIDHHQLMDGDTNNTFRGDQPLNRYEGAAVIAKFVKYVDKCYKPLIPRPTAIPTPVATPTPRMKKPLSITDLRLGGSLRFAESTINAGKQGMLYGPEADLKVWFPKWGWTRFGLGVDSNWHLFDQNDFKTNNRIKAGGNLNWRLFGNDSDEDASLYLGAGYEYFRIGTTASHGPRGTLALEIPVFSWFSLFAEDTFSYYLFKDADGMTWKNELFAGITIPAYTNFSVQLGFTDTRYARSTAPDFSNLLGTGFGDSGGKANLRFRF